MTSESQVRSTLLQYLAGRLTESERSLFEERLLSDQEFSDAIAVLEQEAIDAYAMGSLSPEEASSIRPWIEGSLRRQERVKMARAFLTARQTTSIRKRYLTAILATAACILVAAGATLLRMHRPSEKVGPASLPERARSAVSAPPHDTSSQDGIATKPAVILVIAERIRGERPTATYQIPREAPVELQILLPSGTKSQTYSLEVISLSKEHGVLLKRDNLQPRTEAGQVYIAASFAPDALPPATYEVVVNGGGATLTSVFALQWSRAER